VARLDAGDLVLLVGLGGGQRRLQRALGSRVELFDFLLVLGLGVGELALF
jgi:hypothetical protein